MREIYIVLGYLNASANGQATLVARLGGLIPDPLPFFDTVHGSALIFFLEVFQCKVMVD